MEPSSKSKLRKKYTQTVLSFKPKPIAPALFPASCEKCDEELQPMMELEFKPIPSWLVHRGPATKNMFTVTELMTLASLVEFIRTFGHVALDLPLESTRLDMKWACKALKDAWFFHPLLAEIHLAFCKKLLDSHTTANPKKALVNLPNLGFQFVVAEFLWENRQEYPSTEDNDMPDEEELKQLCHELGAKMYNLLEPFVKLRILTILQQRFMRSPLFGQAISNVQAKINRLRSPTPASTTKQSTSTFITRLESVEEELFNLKQKVVELEDEARNLWNYPFEFNIDYSQNIWFNESIGLINRRGGKLRQFQQEHMSAHKEYHDLKQRIQLLDHPAFAQTLASRLSIQLHGTNMTRCSYWSDVAFTTDNTLVEREFKLLGNDRLGRKYWYLHQIGGVLICWEYFTLNSDTVSTIQWFLIDNFDTFNYLLGFYHYQQSSSSLQLGSTSGNEKALLRNLIVYAEIICASFQVTQRWLLQQNAPCEESGDGCIDEAVSYFKQGCECLPSERTFLLHESPSLVSFQQLTLYFIHVLYEKLLVVLSEKNNNHILFCAPPLDDPGAAQKWCLGLYQEAIEKKWCTNTMSIARTTMNGKKIENCNLVYWSIWLKKLLLEIIKSRPLPVSATILAPVIVTSWREEKKGNIRRSRRVAERAANRKQSNPISSVDSQVDEDGSEMEDSVMEEYQEGDYQEGGEGEEALTKLRRNPTRLVRFNGNM